LLCFGRDHSEPTYLAVKDALIEAVRSGQIPASRLEESAERVHSLRSWAAAQRSALQRPAPAEDIGLAAARRAIQVHGSPGPLTDPLLAEIVPPSNIAVGTVPWGLGNWIPAGNVRRITTADDPAAAQAVLSAASGRSLIVVVRDAHRYPVAQEIVSALITARPDAVIVEMGLPVWHPPAEVYLATFGATRASSQAAAQLLGLTT
jgi:beta-N-acetylhexosaminidase